MAVVIRLLQSIAEYRAAEQLQRDVWGLEEVEIVPDHLMLTAQMNGGLVLGAFEAGPDRQERLVGFACGLLGLAPEGRLKHCSDMVGVHPAYQNQGVGYRLKLAQREHVLRQGIDLITWTFDLLESRNAYLNFHKLGVTCDTYLRNLYGGMRDGLNAGLESDRFQVDWAIASRRVFERLRGDGPGMSLSTLQAQGTPVLNNPLPGEPVHPPQAVLPIAGERFLIQIPARFQAIKEADMGLACAWRMHTRALFEAAFEAGYVVVDLLHEAGESCYLLHSS
ncbi:MAG TPA: GNAT family N-acetyltransferase [Chloroflexi bacterium]|nr:GNAT family N-acetyltransferase [Chloroflexota bacterium]